MCLDDELDLRELHLDFGIDSLVVWESFLADAGFPTRADWQSQWSENQFD